MDLVRYRKLDANGDYSFGHGQADFFVNEPAAVGQAILTRLYLNLGEWFLNTSDGTDWKTKVLGKYTAATRDPVVRERIFGTPHVLSMSGYYSTLDPATRRWVAYGDVQTTYGTAPLALPI